QQRGVFDDCVILAVAAAGLNGLERSTPMVRNAPLGFVARRSDCKINGSVDQTHASTAASPGAFRTQADKLPCSSGAALAITAQRHDLQLLRNFGLSAPPFLRKIAAEDGFCVHAEHWDAGMLITNDGSRRIGSYRIRIALKKCNAFDFCGVEKSGSGCGIGERCAPRQQWKDRGEREAQQ